jgi:CspA family cold shock protein
MNLSSVLRCVILGVVLSLPSPFLISFFTNIFGVGINLAILFSTILLVILGCLIISYLYSRPSGLTKPAKQAKAKISSSGREKGTVKWFNVTKGFGFITRDQGEDVFVHYRSIRGDGRRFLSEGQSVEFSVSEGEKGLQADDVVVI